MNVELGVRGPSGSRKDMNRVPIRGRVDVGVDVGGTFTDFVGFRGRSVVTAKLPSTRDPSGAVLAGMRELGGDEMAHGTTVATNAILERRGARTAFVTTAGFEDLLTIGRQNRPSLYDLRVTRAEPAVPRDRCVGVRERVDARGRVLRKPTATEIARVARAVRASGAESVAISFLFSFLHPGHERLVARALGDLPVSMSHEVLAEFREYERSSTTVLDAYVKPLVVRYLSDLAAALGRRYLVMRSSGGVATHSLVMHRPIELVLSGPAGGVAAAASLARVARLRKIVSFDMGGTSADFSVLDGGRPAWTKEGSIESFPIGLPIVDIESVGAGGGSIAWIDSGGALRVGPESAGAEPGPIAYGKGGQRVTVADADAVGGILGDALLGGRLPLDIALARKGIERFAEDLRVSLDQAILGIQQVVRASMTKAMRIVLARRGLDPREHSLLAFGGAGPMHAWALGRELGVRDVAIPFLPGAFSAYGILISPIQLEYSRSAVGALDRSDATIRQTIAEFTQRAEEDLRSQEFNTAQAVLEPSVDLRFRGQSYEINVPIRGNLAAAFRSQHRKRFGYAASSESIELVTLRLAARVPRPVHRPVAAAAVPAPRRSRRVLFEEGWMDTRIVPRDSLGVGAELEGPAIVEEEHATTVVPPDAQLRVRPTGILEIRVTT